jgi:CRP-like cAMP-binding protein
MVSGIKPEFLKQIDFFSDFEMEALRLILLTCEQKSFSASETIFNKGDLSDGGYVVARGRLALYDGSLTADPIGFAEPGVLVGVLALLSMTERPVTAIATESSLLLQISRGSFKRILQEHPLSAQRLLNQVSSKLSAFINDLKLIA